MEEVKAAYELGVQAGIKMMMDKIENHYKQGKPVLANGRLYWMKNDIQHLHEVMDSLEVEAKESSFVKKEYIVPMRKVVDGKCEDVKVIISATTPYEAWCGAIYNFNKETGWIVFAEYDKYEELK